MECIARLLNGGCDQTDEQAFYLIGDLSTLKESKKQNEWQVLVQPVMSDVCPHLRLYERLSNPQTCLLNWWIATRFKQTKPMDSDAVLEVRHAEVNNVEHHEEWKSWDAKSPIR